ncbi:MAG TPA: hypothetical protein VGQ12_18095 [Candidatus Angelobacter sp.]|jgi:hypothetical protein|nr:hypothetical protein [Candidatus Angelobacter sp.]
MSPEIELLTTLSSQPFSACEEQWKQLLRSLFLPIAYVPAVQAVLEKGRWKSQPDPMAYVRKGSLRCAVRLGIVDVRRNHRRETLATDLNFKGADGKPLGHDDRLGFALHRRDEQFRTGLGAEYGSIYDEDDITNRLPRAVLDKNLEVKWDQVAEMAQMDSGERIVLKLRLSGLERDIALAACHTDDDRKILQAAWKRFDRHKDLFKEVLMSGKALPARPPTKPVRPAQQTVRSSSVAQEHRANQTNPASETPSATPQLEMIFIELPQGGMKISFRKCIADKK